MPDYPLIQNVTKRSGELAPYDEEKLIKWAIYGVKKLKGRVQTQAIVDDVRASLYDGIATTAIQNLLIGRALKEDNFAGQLMAGALYAPMLHKDVYPEGIPSVYEQHKHMHKLGLMKKLNYTKKEYDAIEAVIDHTDDFKLAHFQIKQLHRKYGLTNRVTGDIYETPQFIYIRMAMEFCSSFKENRIFHVLKMFSHLKRTINAPTPNYTNAGTHNKGLISCAVSIAGDSIPSLNVCDTINYRLTAIGSGIGTFIQSRSLGDPIRNGAIEHNGKLPYFALQGKEIKANMQGARAGAGTTYYECYDPEAFTIATLQNPRTPEMRRNRDIHFAVKYHPHFITKAMLDEPVFTFNAFTAPDLTEAMHGKDKKKFYDLYDKYEKDESFVKNYVSARDLTVLYEQQAYDIGTHYDFFTYNANHHTPFKEKIHSSNLCLEIMEVNSPYDELEQLFHDGYFHNLTFKDTHTNSTITLPQNGNAVLLSKTSGESFSVKVGDLEEGMGFVDESGKEYHVGKVIKRDQQPETAFCSLGGIVEPAVKDDDDYREATYYGMVMIDYTIQNSSFAFPHMAFTARKRNNAGLGLLGAATTMAREGLRYDTTEGLNKIHRMAERHMYFALEASLKLGQERGNAPWMHKTLWPEGWLPIDTYSREIDKICPQALIYDWEDLRGRIITNKGIRFSVNVAHMPTESSSKASGYPNSWYPVRELSMVKSDANNYLEWAAMDSDLLKDNYQLSWTISREAMIKVYAVIQKFTDQGISADLYADRSQTLDLSAKAMLEEVRLMQVLGLKSRYYVNSKTDSDAGLQAAVGCSSGACTL